MTAVPKKSIWMPKKKMDKENMKPNLGHADKENMKPN